MTANAAWISPDLLVGAADIRPAPAAAPSRARPATFDALFERYGRLVRALVRRYAHTARDTEDLVQDVFLEVVRKRDTVRDPERLKGWVVALALNHARSWGRRKRTEQRALGRLARPDAHHPEVGRTVEQAEARARVHRALDGLADPTRAVVTLRYLEGLNATEIGRVLGISPEAVRMRLSRGLRALCGRLTADRARSAGTGTTPAHEELRPVRPSEEPRR